MVAELAAAAAGFLDSPRRALRGSRALRRRFTEALRSGPRLPFAAFRNHLGKALEVDVVGREAGHRLADDLEWDSVQHLEALVAVEELGVELDDGSAGPEQTLGGLHELYVRAVRALRPAE